MRSGYSFAFSRSALTQSGVSATTALGPAQFIGVPVSTVAKVNDRIVLPVYKEATVEPGGLD